MSLCIVLFRSTKQLAHSKEPFSINNVSINRRHLWDLWRFWLSFLLDIIDKFRFVRNLLTSPDTFRINWEVSPALYSGARFDYLTIWLLIMPCNFIVFWVPTLCKRLPGKTPLTFLLPYSLLSWVQANMSPDYRGIKGTQSAGAHAHYIPFHS